VTLRIGWFSTGRDQDAIDILARVHRAISEGKLDARIEYVFSNRERGEAETSDRFLDFAASLGLPVAAKSSARFLPDLRKQDRERWRRLYDQEVMPLIAPFTVDVCVLAGYMLIASDVLHSRCVMLNLHPAKPDGPMGTWENVIWQTIAERQDEAGAMIHVATSELDRGPVVGYCAFPIKGGAYAPLWAALARKLRDASLEDVRASEGYDEPLFAAIRRDEFRREVPLLIAALSMVAAGRVAFKDGAVLVDGKASTQGLCLNDRVEAQLAEERP
jgi:phosphoribosylglycinamide formyltransferase-1